MAKKTVQSGPRSPVSTVKISKPAHHLLTILSPWLKMNQTDLIQALLVQCLETQEPNLKKIINEWMAQTHGADWREDLKK